MKESLKTILRFILAFLILMGIVFIFYVGLNKPDERHEYKPRKEVSVDTLRYCDSVYILSTRIDTVFIDK